MSIISKPYFFNVVSSVIMRALPYNMLNKQDKKFWTRKNVYAGDGPHL